MKLKKHEVLPMGFGLSTGGEYRIPNNNPPQRSPETNIIQQISSQSSQSSTNTNRLIQQKPRSLANQHNPTKSNSHK